MGHFTVVSIIEGFKVGRGGSGQRGKWGEGEVGRGEEGSVSDRGSEGGGEREEDASSQITHTLATSVLVTPFQARPFQFGQRSCSNFVSMIHQSSF